MPTVQDYTDPQRTLRLLDELESLGFADKAFQALHHFGKDVTIAGHREYCRETDEFRAERRNSHVQQRLEIVLRAFWSGGFNISSPKPEVFQALAEAAVAELPFMR